MSQTHHISYDPEVTEIISVKEHVKLHGHGTGPIKGSLCPKFKGTVIGKLPVKQVGGSTYLLLPRWWVKKFKVNKVSLTCGTDILVKVVKN